MTADGIFLCFSVSVFLPGDMFGTYLEQTFPALIALMRRRCGEDLRIIFIPSFDQVLDEDSLRSLAPPRPGQSDHRKPRHDMSINAEH